MKEFVRWTFFAVLVRPLVFFLMGLNIRHKHRLPFEGPAIVIANHNSHLDTLVLMSIFPLKVLATLHPAAAADYFLKNKALAWFSLHIMGILPIARERKSHVDDPLAPICSALEKNHIVILYPEGSRGEPEELARFKNGIWHLSKRFPDIPVVPIFLHGLGKALPKGEAIFVPFFCDVFVGEKVPFHPDREVFMQNVEAIFQVLAEKGGFPLWR